MRRSLLRPLAVCAALACTFVAKNARAEDPPISDAAREHFKAGVSLLQDPDGARVEDAYREFKAAYDQSSSPKILGNMGYCAMKLERDGEAIDAYSRYLREVTDIDAEERAQIVRDLQTLTVGVVRLDVDATPTAVLVSDVRIPVKGDRIENVYAPDAKGHLSIGIRPGHHVITARVQGFQDATWEFEAYAGAKESHAFALAQNQVVPPSPPYVMPQFPDANDPRFQHHTNYGPWIVVGVGAAMLVTSAITGVVALNKSNDISNSCPNSTCPGSFDLASARSSARTFVTATDILWIGGALVVGGGVTWMLLSSGNSTSGMVEKPANHAVSGGAMCTGAGCAGTLRVTF